MRDPPYVKTVGSSSRCYDRIVIPRPLRLITLVTLLACGQSAKPSLRNPAAIVQPGFGFSGGDAAVGVALPGVQPRTLWLFGDSLITGVADGKRLYHPDGLLRSIVFGNTIAIEDRTTSSTRSYARDAAGAVTDITRDVANDFVGQAFFDHAMLGLTRKTATTFLWPRGGTCIDCRDATPDNDRVLLGFGEVTFCDPSRDTQCTPLCGVMGEPVKEPCTNGIAPGETTVIVRIENPREIDPARWKVNAVRFESAIAWGAAFLEQNDSAGRWLYVYGTQRAATDFDLHVARVKADDALQPMTAEHAAVAHGVSAYVGVLEVRRHGELRYLLTYDGTHDHYFYLRTSTAPTHWADVTADTPRIDLVAIDPVLARIIDKRTQRGACSGDPHACAVSYHGKVIDALTTTDAHGPATLSFNYILPSDAAGAFDQLDVYRPRLGTVPLDHLEPWCTRAKQPCWHRR